MSDAGIAAILSLAAPGLGQVYNGEILRGVFWLVVTPGFWLGTGGLLGGACHVLSAATAFRRARMKEQTDHRQKEARGESVTIECISPCPAQ
jgi:hypothetical protein